MSPAAGAEATFEAYVAERWRQRLLGLALLAAPPPHGLLIPRCSSVHTVGMRFAIDVAFVTWRQRSLSVLELHPCLPPRRLAGLSRPARTPPRRALATLELAAGRAAELAIEPGAELRVAQPAPEAASSPR